MKPIAEMSLGELAAYIDTHLREEGIDVVLSGGACVAIYSNHQYVSKDLDFVARFTINRLKVDKAMEDLEFERKGRYYYHPRTPYFVEFIPGPPSIGQEPIKETREIKMSTGIVRTISPTDSVKDRLAAFFYWGDRQSLEQAILVSKSNPIDLGEVESWSSREGKSAEFYEFKRRLENG